VGSGWLNNVSGRNWGRERRVFYDLNRAVGQFSRRKYFRVRFVLAEMGTPVAIAALQPANPALVLPSRLEPDYEFAHAVILATGGRGIYASGDRHGGFNDCRRRFVAQLTVPPTMTPIANIRRTSPAVGDGTPRKVLSHRPMHNPTPIANAEMIGEEAEVFWGFWVIPLLMLSF
jgi:hypothetical protein